MGSRRPRMPGFGDEGVGTARAGPAHAAAAASASTRNNAATEEEEADCQIILIARRDVSAGEELTYDCKFDPDESEDRKVPCLCKAPNCRGYMN